MFKLALDAGHGLYTSGKRCLKSLDPNETREWVLNSRICNKIQHKLSEYDNIEVLRVDDASGQTDIALNTRCVNANNFNANFYLSVHHNAGIAGGTGGGYEVYRYSGLSENGNTAKKQKIIAQKLLEEGVSKGNRSSNIRQANFAVLRDTKMEAVLVECAYMDSATDVPILLTEDFAERVANALTKSIVEFFNLIKKPIKQETDSVEQPSPQEGSAETQEPQQPQEQEVVEKQDAENIIISFFKLLIRLIKGIFKGKA